MCTESNGEFWLLCVLYNDALQQSSERSRSSTANLIQSKLHDCPPLAPHTSPILRRALSLRPTASEARNVLVRRRRSFATTAVARYRGEQGLHGLLRPAPALPSLSSSFSSHGKATDKVKPERSTSTKRLWRRQWRRRIVFYLRRKARKH